MRNHQVQVGVLRASAAATVSSETAAPYQTSFSSWELELWIQVTAAAGAFNNDFILECSLDDAGTFGWYEVCRVTGVTATGTHSAAAVRGTNPMGKYLRLRWVHNITPISVTFEARVLMA